ncbi:siderophore-interacting protein [Aquabacter cavernae]|uniref:siderophore-interacting protein n=1 Tax=Aquabacter cavernae TaxID=2496029 RepID=UPI000F8F3A5B|nr:siderophore-interacting protein [Aquabacter cavernae]
MAEPLTAHARMKVGEPERMIIALSAHFADHAALTPLPRGVALEAPRFGRLTLAAEGAFLVAACESPTPSALAFLKMYTAEGMLRASGGTPPDIAWQGDGAGAGPLPFFRELTVVRSEEVTPLMRRVVLAGDAAHFASGSYHVRVLIPPAARPPVWPHAAADGRMIWPSGPDALVARVYTVRSVDLARGEIAIDVVLHGGHKTPGSDWARHAQAGDRVGLLGPGGATPALAAHVLLAGDETALPAIARCLETLSPSTHAVVRIEVQDRDEEQNLPSPATLDLRYLHRGTTAPGRADLLEAAVREAVPLADPAELSVFVACEQAQARRIRALVSGAGVAKERRMVAAYWRLGHTGEDIGE